MTPRGRRRVIATPPAVFLPHRTFPLSWLHRQLDLISHLLEPGECEPSMTRPATELGQRIKELRLRHYGRAGKSEFAKTLQTPLDEYERFERATIPTGEILVRMCEETGEDLQWLLTGAPSRGTMVISGARDRHQELIAKLARLLETSPESAASVDAFVDLLSEAVRMRASPAATARQELPPPRVRDLVPILNDDELPRHIAAQVDAGGQHSWLAAPVIDGGMITRHAALLTEPDVRAGDGAARELSIVRVAAGPGRAREFVESEQVAGCFPDIFGVRIPDDAMSPLFRRGDVALVSAGVAAAVGRPAVFRLGNREGLSCGIWLEQADERITLGRLSDGGEETVSAAEVLWSLEVLYRVRPAA